jgi:hypothetical protein
VAAAVVVLVLAGLIALWVADPFADNSSDAQGSSTAGTSASQPATRSSQPAATSASESSAATSAAATSADNGTGRPQDVDKATKDFFKDIPGNLQAAYQLTSPGFQGRFSYGSFSGFWDDFKDVKISNVQSSDGTSATLDILYVFQDGRQQTEHHLLQFVEGDGGRLLLDSDNQAG